MKPIRDNERRKHTGTQPFPSFCELAYKKNKSHTYCVKHTSHRIIFELDLLLIEGVDARPRPSPDGVLPRVGAGLGALPGAWICPISLPGLTPDGFTTTPGTGKVLSVLPGRSFAPCVAPGIQERVSIRFRVHVWVWVRVRVR